jgi:hypothetical protein
MTHSTDRDWQPATIEDLVADALALGVDTASPRMITDWTEDGLLGSPEFQKSTRYGSDARLYPPEQRRLFHELLRARQRSPLARVPKHTLIRPVLHLWLTDDNVISTMQARRAWRTWAKRAGKNTAAARRGFTRQVVDQWAHPCAPYHQRRKAQLLLEQGEKTGVPDWDKLYSALTEVCSPWPAPQGQRIERAIGISQQPAGVQEAIALWMLGQKVTALLRQERVIEGDLDRARAEHRRGWQEYEASQTRLRQQATNPEAFDRPSTVEGQVKRHVEAFIPTLGHTLGLTRETFAQARALAP